MTPKLDTRCYHGEEEGGVRGVGEEEKSGKDESKSSHKEPSTGAKEPVKEPGAITPKDGDGDGDGLADPHQPELTGPSPEKTGEKDKVKVPDRDDATKLANKEELERLAKIDTTPKKKKLTPEEEEDERMCKIIAGEAVDDDGDDDGANSLPGVVVQDREGTKLASKDELDKLGERACEERVQPPFLTP